MTKQTIISLFSGRSILSLLFQTRTRIRSFFKTASSGTAKMNADPQLCDNGKRVRRFPSKNLVATSIDSCFKARHWL
jgi:hypothetical protein